MGARNVAPGNVYVNLDEALPASLKLNVEQNLIFIRDIKCASGPFLRSLKMPENCFVTADDLSHDYSVPGQPAGTYVVALGLVHAEGTGEVLISFSSGPLIRLGFCITK